MERLRPSHIAALITTTENAITVNEIASTDLWWATPDADTPATFAFMRSREYDVAPLLEPLPYRFVRADDIADGKGELANHAKAIDAAHIVSADLGLAQAVVALARQPFYFVLAGQDLKGVVTTSDVQRPAVGMVTLSLILICEAGLNQLIPIYLGPDWPAKLSPDSRARSEALLAERRRYNANLGLIDCLMIHDRLALVAKSPTMLRDLGFPARGPFEDWSGRMTRLRDVLAHAGTLLHHEPEPLRAIAAFTEVRRLARRTWELVEPHESEPDQDPQNNS